MLLVEWMVRRVQYVSFAQPLTYLDLLLVSSVILISCLYLRRFPVFKVLLGIGILLLAAVIFFAAGFIFTALLFAFVSLVVLIDVPLIFAPEIRHYLEKLGRFPFKHVRRVGARRRRDAFIPDFVEAVFSLVERKVGALIVIERQTSLGTTVETGEIIDARFSERLLQNIFYPKSPLHDGAVVMVGDRIIAAGCLLPINPAIRLRGPVGTRHRSAVAITQDTDAIVVVISEERHEVSLAQNNTLQRNISRAELANQLQNLLRFQ